MTTKLFVSTLAFAVLCSVDPCFGASAKPAKKAAPVSPAPAAKGGKPDVEVDNSPVSEGAKSGFVMSYADVLEPAQKAVVSVYSTKIIKERIALNPLLR